MVRERFAETSRARGTYVLVLRLMEAGQIRVGKLGEFPFPAGHYLYVGSARGSGGLATRVARHRRTEKRLHWHIDYLTRRADIIDVWHLESPRNLECVMAEAIGALPGAGVPVPGFGSSDCRCPAHLFYFSELPDSAMFPPQGWLKQKDSNLPG